MPAREKMLTPGSEEWRVAVADAAAELAAREQPDDYEETAQDRVAGMLKDARASESAKVRLYRKKPGDKKLAWCADYTPEEFEAGGFEMIRRDWGAGNYDVRVYGETTGGGHGVIGRAEVEVLGSLTPTAVPASSSSELAQVLARMSEQQATQNAAILQALQNRPDPMAAMKESFTLMTMMREAMGMSGQSQPQKSSIGEIIEAIKELQSAKELLGGEKPEAEEDNLMSMVSKISDLAKVAMSRPDPMTFPPVAIPPSLTPAIPRMPESIPQPQTTENDEMSIKELRDAFARLLEMALANAPVEEAAELVFAELPDELVPVLRGQNWFGALQMIAPEIKPHEEYFTKVRDAALIIFDEEIDAANEGRPAP